MVESTTPRCVEIPLVIEDFSIIEIELFDVSGLTWLEEIDAPPACDISADDSCCELDSCIDDTSFVDMFSSVVLLVDTVSICIGELVVDESSTVLRIELTLGVDKTFSSTLDAELDEFSSTEVCVFPELSEDRVVSLVTIFTTVDLDMFDLSIILSLISASLTDANEITILDCSTVSVNDTPLTLSEVNIGLFTVSTDVAKLLVVVATLSVELLITSSVNLVISEDFSVVASEILFTELSAVDDIPLDSFTVVIELETLTESLDDESSNDFCVSVGDSVIELTIVADSVEVDTEVPITVVETDSDIFASSFESVNSLPIVVIAFVELLTAVSVDSVIFEELFVFAKEVLLVELSVDFDDKLGSSVETDDVDVFTESTVPVVSMGCCESLSTVVDDVEAVDESVVCEDDVVVVMLVEDCEINVLSVNIDSSLVRLVDTAAELYTELSSTCDRSSDFSGVASETLFSDCPNSDNISADLEDTVIEVDFSPPCVAVLEIVVIVLEFCVVVSEKSEEIVFSSTLDMIDETSILSLLSFDVVEVIADELSVNDPVSSALSFVEVSATISWSVDVAFVNSVIVAAVEEVVAEITFVLAPSFIPLTVKPSLVSSTFVLVLKTVPSSVIIELPVGIRLLPIVRERSDLSSVKLVSDDVPDVGEMLDVELFIITELVDEDVSVVDWLLASPTEILADLSTLDVSVDIELSVFDGLILGIASALLLSLDCDVLAVVESF